MSFSRVSLLFFILIIWVWVYFEEETRDKCRKDLPKVSGESKPLAKNRTPKRHKAIPRNGANIKLDAVPAPQREATESSLPSEVQSGCKNDGHATQRNEIKKPLARGEADHKAELAGVKLRLREQCLVEACREACDGIDRATTRNEKVQALPVDIQCKVNDTYSHVNDTLPLHKIHRTWGRLVRGSVEESVLSRQKQLSIVTLILTIAFLGDREMRQKLKSVVHGLSNAASIRELVQAAIKGQSQIRETWRSNFDDPTPLWKRYTTFVPRPPVYRIVAPATSFLPEMGSSIRNNMAHLGCRLASLAALPASCDVSRTRLAQAGFYYDNSNTSRNANNIHEVVCYSCGVTWAQWERGDNPMVVHRRLKPDCEYIKSQGPDVFPPEPSPPSLSSGPSSLSSLSTFSTDSSLSSLTSMSSWTSSSSISSESSQASSVFVGAEEQPQRNGYSDLQTDCAAIAPFPLPPRDHVTVPSQSRHTHSSFARNAFNGSAFDDPDDKPQLCMDSAVYPQFSTISERLATFQGWPLGRYFKPEDLVYDGFYFAGYADCLRCFHCGVGLKSWDQNDCVMDEHIRWRPSCGYILAVKGRRFVTQTLQRLRANVYEEVSEPRLSNGTQVSSGARNGSATQGSSFALNGIDSATPATQASNSAPRDNSSEDALGAARRMGFPEQDIARAIGDLNQPDVSSIDKQTFIEYLISMTTVVDGNETIARTSGAHGNGDLHTDGPSVADSPQSQHAQEVIAENQRLRCLKTCKICNTGTVGVIFLPCGHLLACTDCAGRTRNCTRCGQYIRATANVFLS